MPTLTTCRAAPARATFAAPLLVQAVGADGTFEGYASLFNFKDQGNDVVVPGAFGESLKRRGGARGVRMLFQHDANQPIGVWTTVREDARGLYVTGRLLPDVAKSREVHALLRAGAIDGLSIGFRALSGKRDRHGVRHLTRIDLWEISVVTFPMLAEARVSAVKTKRRALGVSSALPQATHASLADRMRHLSRDLDALTNLRTKNLSPLSDRR